LTDLEDGDLKVTVDFRQIYASVLENWLGIPSETALAVSLHGCRCFRINSQICADYHSVSLRMA
jgi:uncharacterized protein (DUF1501 family)